MKKTIKINMGKYELFCGCCGTIIPRGEQSVYVPFDDFNYHWGCYNGIVEKSNN